MKGVLSGSVGTAATGFLGAMWCMQAGQIGTTLDQVNEEKFIGPVNEPSATVTSEDFINDMTYDEVSQMFDVYEPFNPLALVDSDQMSCANPNSKLLEGEVEFSLQDAYMAFNMSESYLKEHPILNNAQYKLTNLNPDN